MSVLEAKVPFMTSSSSTFRRAGGVVILLVGLFVLGLFAFTLITGQFQWWWLLGVIAALGTVSYGVRTIRSPVKQASASSPQQ